jgi:hypothetical protein
MESIVNDKNYVRPSHDALNTDKHETEAESADRRMNEIANKAAGRGMERQRQDESGKDIISK